jgi:ammonia channel protein AmtB
VSRRLLHALVGVAFWLVFALLWVDLVRDGAATTASLSRTLLLVVLIAALVLAVTGVWVRHNVRIHQRRGPRPGSPLLPPRTDVDRLWRTVVWDLPGGHLRAVETAHLVVDLDPDAAVKTYRRADRGA